MEIPNNLLKQKLQNVYFILGSNCGGKTSMAKALAKKHNMIYYSADDHYWPHRNLSDKTHQPNMNRRFYDWDEYFSRPAHDQSAWLLRCKDEEIPFIILDLIHLAENNEQKIIVDMHNMGDLAKNITAYNQLIYLYAAPETVKEDFFKREDKQPLHNVIKEKTQSPDKALHNLLNTVMLIAEKENEEALNSGFKAHKRDQNTSFEQRLALVEKHFNL